MNYAFKLSLLFVTVLFMIPFVNASLSCSIVPEGTCSDTSVLRLENDTGGFNNAHAQLVNFTGTLYNYEICCSSSTQTVETSCDAGVEFLRLSDEDNAHVQVVDENLNTITYDYPACLGGDGRSICLSTTGSAPTSEDYDCLASIASSEDNDGDFNLTNAHIASCNFYDLNIYCFLNNLPTHDDPVLEASTLDNSSSDKLTVSVQNPSDVDGHSINFSYDWRLNENSIAVLNMPFLSNITSTETGLIRDYTSYENSGTLQGNPGWVDNCIVGGCYEFEAVDGYIETSQLINEVPNTFLVWVKVSETHGSDRVGVIAGNYESSSSNDINWEIHNDGRPRFYWNDGSPDWISSAVDVRTGNWEFLAWVRDTSSGNVYLYHNGIEVDSISNVGSDITLADTTGSETLRIGADYPNTRQPFDGSIDNVQVFNRVLSEEQIQEIYQAGLNGEMFSTLVSQETVRGDNWSVMVTPNDGWDDGESKLSNYIVIETTVLEPPELIYPVDEAITDRETTFNWTEVVDPDGDVVTYDIELEPPEVGFGCFGFDDFNLETIYYNETEELCTDLDYDSGAYSFQWRVRACDSLECGDWSEYASFDIESVNQVIFVNDSVNFGALERNASVNTTDHNPEPFLIENIGNIRVDISGLANESLFDTVTLGTENFRFKARENQQGAFNITSSTMEFINISGSYDLLISKLDYEVNDAFIDLLVTLPSEEPAGPKSTSIVIESIPYD